MVASTDPLADAPAGVQRVQEALAAPSRLMVLRTLMEQPRTFAALAELPPFNNAGTRAGLQDLAALGYVSDHSPAGRQRKSVEAVLSVNREIVLRDPGELSVYLAR